LVSLYFMLSILSKANHLMALNSSRLCEVPTRPVVVETVDIPTQMSSEHSGGIIEQDYPKWTRSLIHLERVRRKTVHEIWDPKLGGYTRTTSPASNFWKKRSIATGMRYADPEYMHLDMSTIFPARGSRYICRDILYRTDWMRPWGGSTLCPTIETLGKLLGAELH